MSSFVLKPITSEKTYQLAKRDNTYVFDVPLSENKLTVRSAVESEFKVTVEDVRTTRIKGKTKQSYRKRSRPVAGKRSDVKHAYIRVKKGEKIPVFAAIEKEEEKAAKAAEKAANTAKEKQ